MEALVALSLAANIAQFVDLGCKIIYEAKDVYDSSSGMTEESVEQENVINSMRLIALKLDGPTTGTQSDEEKSLRRLAGDCRVISQHLDDLLAKAKRRNSKSKHEAAITALRSIWTRKDRLELERRLNNCRSQLELELQFMHSSDIKNRLEGIKLSMGNQVDKLKQIHKHVEDISKGSQVASISTKAQDQIKNLFKLSKSQYDTLAQMHILKGLAALNTTSRFEDVVDAHHDTFQWLFACEDAFDSISEDEQDGVKKPIDEAATTSSKTWSIWQLDDGYEEKDQDWWYQRENNPEVVATRVYNELVAAPEHLHILKAGRRFTRWLSSGDGIFHISGKLGSGKSTLMKYLFSHGDTWKVLSNWADRKTLVLANFFFWKPGSKEQKSLNGLFRSLLHEILQSCPDLMAFVFPEQWDQLMSCPWLVQPNLHFSDAQIRRAIYDVFHQKHTYEKYAFCLFIDGLDEYEETLGEDYKDLIRILQEWVRCSGGGLKICVSSREYNVFQNAFSPEKRIRLQDLTTIDMERYANERLKDLENSEQKSNLVSEIVNKSDGIFLWVALVVKMFREFIENGQNVAAFAVILESLPDELELLFERLLATLNKPSRKRAYQIFALMAHMKERYDENLFLLSTIFLDDHDQNPQFALAPKLPYCDEDMEELEGRAKKLLNGFCRGLVVAKESKLKGSYIAFTHRSVAEFLAKDAVRREMEYQLDGFDVAAVAPHLLLADLRSAKTAKNHGFWARFASSLIAVDFDPEPPFPFLSCLEKIVADKFGRVGTLEMDTSQPFNQQALVVHKTRRYYINIGESIGNFFVVSPFFLSVCFRKLKYVKWKIDLDSTLVRDEHKAAFIRRCLQLQLGGTAKAEALEQMFLSKGDCAEISEIRMVVGDNSKRALECEVYVSQ